MNNSGLYINHEAGNIFMMEYLRIRNVADIFLGTNRDQVGMFRPLNISGKEYIKSLLNLAIQRIRWQIIGIRRGFGF